MRQPILGEVTCRSGVPGHEPHDPRHVPIEGVVSSEQTFSGRGVIGAAEVSPYADRHTRTAGRENEREDVHEGRHRSGRHVPVPAEDDGIDEHRQEDRNPQHPHFRTRFAGFGRVDRLRSYGL